MKSTIGFSCCSIACDSRNGTFLDDITFIGSLSRQNFSSSFAVLIHLQELWVIITRSYENCQILSLCPQIKKICAKNLNDTSDLQSALEASCMMQTANDSQYLNRTRGVVRNPGEKRKLPSVCSSHIFPISDFSSPLFPLMHSISIPGSLQHLQTEKIQAKYVTILVHTIPPRNSHII